MEQKFPKARLLDSSFKYVPSSHTNIRRTFARINRQLAKEKAQNDPVHENAEEVPFPFDKGKRPIPLHAVSLTPHSAQGADEAE